MKLKTIVGIVLVVIGVISLIYRGVPSTTRQKMLQFGPVEAYRKKNKTIPVPPVLGVFAVAGGILLMVAGVRRK